MGAIFLSYAREDRACAEALAKVLDGAGHQVWWDRRIESGLEFAAEIEAALDAADVVLVLWSHQSIKSRWVRDEAAIGGDSGRLVPALIDVAQPPIGFRQFQAFDLAGWKGTKKDKRTAELLGEIERRLERKAGGAPTVPVRPAAAMAGRRWQIGGRGWAIAAALTVLAIAGAILLYLNTRGGGAGESKPTIALAAITSASSDPALRELAAQTRDSLAHTFSRSGVPLQVLGPGTQGRSATDYTISGELSRKGDKVVASIRLDKTPQGVTFFSHRFEAGPDEVRDLPERVGAQMAGNLTWSWPLMVLSKPDALDPTLMADLLGTADFTGDQLRNYQVAKRVVAKAPNLQSAQIQLAFSTAFVLSEIPRGERGEALAEGRRAAERAMALGPDFGDTHAAWCGLHSETRVAECEDRLRAGKRADPDAPFLNTFLSHLLRSVGRFEESMELANLAHTHDIYVPTKIAWMLKSLEFGGESERARELHQQGAKWWPEYKDGFLYNRVFGRLERGDFNAIQRLEKELGAKDLPSSYRDSSAIVAAVKSKSIAAMRRACSDTAYLLSLRCMIASASIGDLDGAYAIADRLYPRRVGRTPAETERMWLDKPDYAANAFITAPAAAPMRRDGRYFQLAERLGLLAYWRSGRPPDFCRKQPEPICAQLVKRPKAGG